jgi:demethylmenaquinone methyltransferase / 2-methoxy-6-polyprenyl-1,4-benzoquinol methylase
MMPRTDSALPPDHDKAAAVQSMFDRIAVRYELVNRIMTLGLDSGWRRRTVELLRLPRGSLVVDVACGTGDFCRVLERAGHCAVGVDFSAGMLAAARTSAPLLQADVLRLPLRDDSVDGVTCGFALRNVVDIGALFDEFARVTRSGGRIAILEVAQPESRPVRWGHALYFTRLVPLIGGLLSDRAAYRYLPESTAYLPGRDALVELARHSGFADAHSTLITMGAAQILAGTRG